jgi:oxygen-independent coproporphyrinogen-3 oxidase
MSAAPCIVDKRLSLYIHIPFCAAKCGYCDFNSYAGQESLIPTYTEALTREARLWAPLCEGRRVETMFFGGGTPSLMPLRDLERVLGRVRPDFDVAADAEVSLEANPGTVDSDYLSDLRSLGVNRLSIGVQSFDDRELAALDRIHSAKEAREAFAAARRAGFDNVNLDLIYGLPRQTPPRWQRNLEDGLALAPEHLSLYALTIEEDTPLGRDVASGRVPEPDPDVAAEMYTWAEERLAHAGYDHYEISNWSKPGFQCRHNVACWRNESWLGLGAGAHSHLRWIAGRETPEAGYRFANVAATQRYIDLVGETWAARRQDGDGPDLDSMRQVTFRERVDRELEKADTLILGLRLTEGVRPADWRARFGEDLEARYGPTLAELKGLGLLEQDDGPLRLSSRGRLLANEVLQRFLPTGES